MVFVRTPIDELELKKAKLEIQNWRQIHDENVTKFICDHCEKYHDKTYASMVDCLSEAIQIYSELAVARFIQKVEKSTDQLIDVLRNIQ